MSKKFIDSPISNIKTPESPEKKSDRERLREKLRERFSKISIKEDDQQKIEPLPINKSPTRTRSRSISPQRDQRIERNPILSSREQQLKNKEKLKQKIIEKMKSEGKL